MKVLFLNLADHGPLGEKSVAALKQKAGTEVDIIQLLVPKSGLKRGAAYREPADPSSELVLVTRKKFNVLQYDKIIIGAHGIFTDREYCYHEDNVGDVPPKKTMTASQLADLFLELMDDEESTVTDLSFMLSICFAARVSMGDDHESVSLDYHKSFAGAFCRRFKEILPNCNLTLEAYTGEVNFDETTGDVRAQSEEQVVIAQEIERIERQKNAVSLEISDLTTKLKSTQKQANSSSTRSNAEDDNDEPTSEMGRLTQLASSEFTILEQLKPLRSKNLRRQIEWGKVLFKITPEKGIEFVPFVKPVSQRATSSTSSEGKEDKSTASILVDDETLPLLSRKKIDNSTVEGDEDPESVGCCAKCNIM